MATKRYVLKMKWYSWHIRIWSRELVPWTMINKLIVPVGCIATADVLAGMLEGTDLGITAFEILDDRGCGIVVRVV